MFVAETGESEDLGWYVILQARNEGEIRHLYPRLEDCKRVSVVAQERLVRLDQAAAGNLDSWHRDVLALAAELTNILGRMEGCGDGGCGSGCGPGYGYGYGYGPEPVELDIERIKAEAHVARVMEES